MERKKKPPVHRVNSHVDQSGGYDSSKLSGISELYNEQEEEQQPRSAESGYGSGSECGNGGNKDVKQRKAVKSPSKRGYHGTDSSNCINDKSNNVKDTNGNARSGAFAMQRTPVYGASNNVCDAVAFSDSTSDRTNMKQTNSSNAQGSLDDRSLDDKSKKVWNEAAYTGKKGLNSPSRLKSNSPTLRRTKSNINKPASHTNKTNDFKMICNSDRTSYENIRQHESQGAKVNDNVNSVLKSVINHSVPYSYNNTVIARPVTFTQKDLDPNDGRIARPVSFTQTDFAPNDGRIALQDKALRIATFRFWPKPHIITGERLADCGFYYLNDRDRVKCVYCNLILRDWELGDDPVVEHKRFSQTCSFERYMTTRTASVADNVRGSDGLGLGVSGVGMGVSYAVPKYQNYAIEASRLKTFDSWPPGKTQTPAVLARAGFLCLGDKDSVMCFFCGLKLVNWAAGDDPWFEHAKHASTCTYVIQSKTQKYVDDVRQAARNGLNHLPTQNTVTATPQQAPSTASTLEQYMNTPAVKSLVEIMMKPKELVMKALKKCLAANSGECPDASTLMDMIFEMEDGDDEDEDADHRSESEDNNNTATTSQLHANPSDTGSTLHNDEPQGAVGGVSSKTPSRTPTAGGASLLSSREPPAFYQRDALPDTPNQVQPGQVVTDSLQKSPSADGKNAGNDSDEDIYSANKEEDEGMPEDFNEDLSSLKIENDELQRQRTCKVCLDEVANIVFLPCGHLTCCSTCSPAIRLCPICRALVRGTVRTFMV